ncbi:MAG: malto-oligosyltrehalose trehalohydrolase [Acidimicrobiales bacterium]|nr:malto-oligosyltrehalose trehalohydrolase [Acidimicrobiales bacterium]
MNARPSPAIPTPAAASRAAGLGVWAPAAERVEIILDASPDAVVRPMQRDEERPGWWRWPHAHHGPYWFVLDGVAHPDPRSPWQPHGPDAASHTWDHAAHRWADHRWHGRPLGSVVLYELHVGTFSPEGTYAGVQQRLDHLEALGVGAIELLPLHTAPGGRGWGYDGVCWFAPHPAYGTPDELKALVDACHARGIAVVVDVVYNHLGPAGNHLWAFGPYFTDRHHTPWGQGLNVDGPDSDEVRRYVVDNAAMWLRDYHVDGLRLDAVHAIVDHSARHLLEELAEMVAELSVQLDRTLWLIAESDANDPRLVRSRDAHGFGLDAQWADDLHHAVHVALTGERDGYYGDFAGLPDVPKAWREVFVRDGTYSPSLRRRHGRPIGELAPRRFVTALQNHDQIGNRARGDRIGTTVGADRQRIGAALVLLAPTVPLLFQGEEWAASTPFQYFTDHPDPALAEAVRQGRRKEFAAFGWRPDDIPDPQAVATFVASTLRWEELDEPAHAAMLAWYRSLLGLRRRCPVPAHPRAMPGGTVEVAVVDEHRLQARLGVLQVAVNLGSSPITFALDAFADPGEPSTVLLQSGTVTVGDGALRLGPDSIAVLGPAEPAGPQPAAPDHTEEEPR